MINLEPHSNYECQSANKEKTLYEVINIEYHDIKIDRAPDIKMISEAFYWMQLLISTMNKDYEAILHESVYNRVFNMMITFFLNSSIEELKKNA